MNYSIPQFDVSEARKSTASFYVVTPALLLPALLFLVAPFLLESLLLLLP